MELAKLCIILLLGLFSVAIAILYHVDFLYGLHRKWESIDILKLENVPDMTVMEVDCHGLFAGKENVLRQAEELQNNMTFPVLTDRQVAKMADNCGIYRNHRGYILQPVSIEAHDFPLSFGIVVYKDAEMIERLLRAIYRPQNYYCIHIDSKATDDFKDAMQSLARCFQNLFISNVSIDVKWGEFSILEANLICMRELWKYKTWKYFIDLTGQEFPLRTNLEIVKIVKAFNGANDIRVSPSKRRWSKRWAKKLKEAPLPRGIHLGKGNIYAILSRAFVNFTLHDKVAIEFYNWLNGTRMPDESFFNSLFISPSVNVPGAYTGSLNVRYLGSKSVLRHVHWAHHHSCSGRENHGVCIITIHDLPSMASSKKVIVNKFHSGYQPLAYSCMEQLIAERVQQEVVTGKSSIGIDYYRKVPVTPHRQ